MTQVNLLPPEIRQRALVRRNTFLVGAAGLLAIGLLLAFFLIQKGKLADVNGQIAMQQATNASLQTEADSLAQYSQLEVEAAAKKQVLTAVYANDISMSGLLQDVSNIIPDSQVLSQLAVVTTAPGTEVTSSSGLTTFYGGVTVTGQVQGIETLSTWINRVATVKGWVNPWVTSASESGPSTGRYTFSSGFDLNQDALTPRGVKGTEAVAAGAGS